MTFLLPEGGSIGGVGNLILFFALLLYEYKRLFYIRISGKIILKRILLKRKNGLMKENIWNKITLCVWEGISFEVL